MLPGRFTDNKVCVLGLGYVGLTLATTMAEVGFEVYGVEIRDDVVEMLQSGVPHVHEPGIAERLRRAVDDGQLRISKTIPPDCPATVYVITVGTPLAEDGRVRLDMIEHVAGEVGKVLKADDMVIMRSTVKVGTTRNVVMPVLERSGQPFQLAFCPERTLEGKAMDELRRLPQIVGADSHDATIRAAQLFAMLTPTTVRVSDIETAEMIKLVDNAQRDVQFAYANEVARVCDALGVSAAEVINAGKLGYPRTNLPMPGPVGGPCLEKDPYILAQSLEDTGVEPEITLTARRLNERQPAEVAAHLRAVCDQLDGFPANPVITLLGLAFKGWPATDDLRGTMAVPILAALREHFPDGDFRGYDAVVSPDGVRSLGLDPCASLEDAMSGSHLVLILNNHAEFAAMPLEDLAPRLAKPAIVYDFWNLFPNANFRLPDWVGYVALGSHGRFDPSGTPA